MTSRELIRKEKIAALKAEMKHGGSVFFCAHIGWGKTVFIRQYFSETKQVYKYISCADDDFENKLTDALNSRAHHIVLDDFQEWHGDENGLVSTISESKAQFYILSRCALPQFLKPLLLSARLSEYSYDFFALSTKEVKELFSINEKIITTAAAREIQKITMGWIFVVMAFLPRYYTGCNPSDIMQQLLPDLYDYADLIKFNGFSEKTQDFLLKMGHIPEFTEEDAIYISGQSNAKEMIDEILQSGSFMAFAPPDKYRFHSFFNGYIEWKQKHECSKEFLNGIYERTSECYDRNGEPLNALKYYKAAGNIEGITNILKKNSEKHPGNGLYYEMREYYLALPDDITNNSPELLCAVSMLYSLIGKPRESEIYYKKLRRLAENGDNAGQSSAAEAKLAFLDIALPHRGTDGLIGILKSGARLAKKRGAVLDRASVTGNMPSVINGGKDLCEWCKNDRENFSRIKEPILTALGDFYSGFTEIALGESLFEKCADKNHTEEIVLLSTGQYEAETNGNIQLWFAALAVTAKIYASQGKLDTATELIKKFKPRLDPKETINDIIDAFVVQLTMLSGDIEYANIWFSNKAPDESSDFYITDRYRYLTKIKIYIIKELYSEALALLSRADRYFCEYGRMYCHIEALILKSIILYRLGDEAWRCELFGVIELCREYGLVWIISKYGAAVLDMLKEIRIDADAEFKEKLLENAREQAVLYPKYLKPQKRKNYELTKSEKTVLKLVCDGLSNEDISSIMGISVRTVKFHLGNIYTKLNVKGRIDAINLCIENDIL